MGNFKLIREENIIELNSLAKIYIHTPTGAEILSISNNDENKCFGVAFKTPPKDSTGVAHILEHTVLCGSKKYPVKDPFVQLLKGSLQTFLNAFTYPDKTCYPVASQNLKDFYNLIDVYLDAVFFPLITPDFFKQEGWHYYLEDIDSPLEYKGVVYNEMKGVYSSPESILMEASQQSLFPDTTYGLDSGGNPEIIPELTYKQFKQFHTDLYHPSNARFVFYGDDPEEERFNILEKYLQSFSKINPSSNIQLQKPFVKPIRISKPYAVSNTEKNPKIMFTKNWTLSSPTNVKDIFEFILLDQILLGTPASPLRKTLIESGLGEDITGGGLQTHLLQMTFSIGLKDVEENNLEKAEKIIIDTFQKLVSEGINHNDIHAALNSFEFDLRENNSGGFPRGLSLWLRGLNGWIYGADPIELIAFEEPLQELKNNSQKEKFFEEMIQKFFIDNMHQSTVVLFPAPNLSKEIELKEIKKLEHIKQQLSSQELKAIQSETKRLLTLQETPDTEKAIDTLPLLKRSDLDPNIQSIDMSLEKRGQLSIIKHPFFTNGVLYIDLGLNLHSLNSNEIPFAGLLSQIYLEIGTKNEDYASLSQRIAKSTGGIYGIPFISPREDFNETTMQFFIRGKCMINQTDDLLAILNDIFRNPDFDNQVRFKQILLEHKSDLESSIIPRGHSAVMTRLKARYHTAHWANEQIGGIDGLFFIRNLLIEIDNDWPSVLARIKTIHDKLIRTNNITLNITCDQKNLDLINNKIDNFLSELPSKKEIPLIKNYMIPKYPTSEALLVPSRINFVGASSNLFNFGYHFHGSSIVITRYLQTAWLWEKIRVQGGAYGGMCSFDHRAGVFTFASYRDPNLIESIETYKQTGNFLKNLKLDEKELTRALIGAIGQLDTYELPDTKSLSSCKRILLGYTPKDRQKLRDEVLATTEKDFNYFGEILHTAFENPNLAVLCDKDSATKAKIKTMTEVL